MATLFCVLLEIEILIEYLFGNIFYGFVMFVDVIGCNVCCIKIEANTKHYNACEDYYNCHSKNHFYQCETLARLIKL